MNNKDIFDLHLSSMLYHAIYKEIKCTFLQNLIDKTTFKFKYFDVHGFCRNDICLRKMFHGFTEILAVTIKQCFFFKININSFSIGNIFHTMYYLLNFSNYLI